MAKRINVRTLKKFHFTKIMIVLPNFSSDLLKKFDAFKNKVPGASISFTTGKVHEQERAKYQIVLYTEDFGYFSVLNVRNPQIRDQLISEASQPKITGSESLCLIN